MQVITCFALCCLLLVHKTESRNVACETDHDEPWTYRGRNGPVYWGEVYPMCYGVEQSPIDVKTADAIKGKDLPKLELQNYEKPVTEATVKNNGHTIQVTPNDDVERSIMVNGSTYTLRQFHFHWGYYYDEGSEHTLDGQQYAMEMHLVHINEEDRIAVVGVIFQETLNGNEELQKVVDTFSKVKYKGDETALHYSLNLNTMVPDNPASYYRYEGSLTTPACAEGVSWSVLTGIMKVSNKQMLQFQQLLSVTKEDASVACGLSGNYRPVQPLNGREVYRSS